MTKGRFWKVMPILYIFLDLFFASFIFTDEANYLGSITIVPAMPKSGDKVVIKADLPPGELPVNDVIITGGIDSELLFRKTFKEIPHNAIKSVKFIWIAQAGRHNAWFKLSPAGDTGNLSKSIDFVETSFIVPGGIDSIPWTALPASSSLRGQDISEGLLDDMKAELPDLVLPDPPDRYLIAYKGEKIVVPIAIKNSSGSSAAASFLSVKCNEKGVQSEQLLVVPPLNQGEQITLSVEYVPQSEWDILCDVSIDPDMSIPELNENNNSNRFTLQVWTKSLPDLVPSMTYSLMSTRKLRWNITVRNIGDKESESIEYITSLICRKGSSVLPQADVPAQLPRIPALQPGKSYIFNSSSKVEGDICTFTIKVDALDKMPESNEGNNIAEVTVRLK
jgi:hypothetical protein